MRFERLDLRAFGPFTGEQLDFSGGAPGGLHVVYGANEAGKSTTLRAVKALLFGMPHRSVDSHLHPATKLNLGAVLSAEGREYEFTRLKRRKDDLLDASGSPISENPLPALLGNLDERSFSSRFGLDQVELERGAEALLGGSEQGLFAAGTAGAEARQVLELLSKEYSELFLPRGKIPRLNRALAEHQKAAREAKHAERPPEQWIEQEKAHRQAKEVVSELKKKRAEVRLERSRLNRLRSLLSQLTAYDETGERLRALGDVPELGDAAPAIRQAAELKKKEAEFEARRIREEEAAFEEELAALAPQSSLLEVDEKQLDLSTRTGFALSAQKDLPKREAALLEHARQAASLLAELGRRVASGAEIATAREALPAAQTTATVERLLTQRGALTAELDAAEQSLKKLRAESIRLEQESSFDSLDAQSLEAIEAALVDAQSTQSLLSAREQGREKEAELRLETGLVAEQLGVELAAPKLSGLLPLAEQVASWVKRHRELQQTQKQVQDSLLRLQRDCRGLREQLAGEKSADVPSEERLKAARERRNLQLSLVEEAEPSSGKLQLSGLREAILEADELSDRLRREADRVAKVDALTRQVQALEARISVGQEKEAEITAQLSASENSHRQRADTFGCSRVPLVEESESWYANLRKWVDQQARLKKVREENGARDLRLSDARARLAGTLDEVPEDSELPALVSLATRRLREGSQAQERRRQLGQQRHQLVGKLDEAELRLVRATEDLAFWQSDWARAVEPLGLPRDVSVERAQQAMSVLVRLARLMDQVHDLEGRIQSMRADKESLSDDVIRIAKRHCPELIELDPVEAAVRLQELMRAAHRTKEERLRLRELLQKRRDSLSLVEKKELSAQSELDALMERGMVASVEELPAVEKNDAERRQLLARHSSLKEAIVESSDGASIEELLTEAKQWRGQERGLVARANELDEEDKELEEGLRQAESEAETSKQGLDTYRSEDVVIARQGVSSRAAEARAALREYLVLRTAHRLLHDQVESYAERFSGPIAGRAGELFKRLTLGRYHGLSIGVGERTLRCVTEGQELEVSELSRGTRAQLYFALRLASLEQYFSENPGVPLVFDDLLVEFDDDRARVAFEILSDLSKKVQVLYFTHLARDVTSARDTVSKELLFTHQIGSR